MSSVDGPIRILGAEDHAQISQLYGQYIYVTDFGSAEEYAGCFSENGTLQIGEGPAAYLVTGRSVILKWRTKGVIERDARVLWTRHWYGMPRWSILGNGTVVGGCYMYALKGGGVASVPPYISDCGVWADEIVTEDGRWCFARRTLHYDYNTSASLPR